MREKFEEIAFQAKTLKIIEQANVIIAEMQAAGYTLTVRQLYYQFVARDMLANTMGNYKRLAGIVDNARKAGLIDWDAIEDRTRYLRKYTTFANPAAALAQAANGYCEDVWADQDFYCEVWIEKDALLGVIERPCNEFRVPYFACRGYPSSSELYTAGKRLKRIQNDGRNVVIFYLGDHDPSGLDMTRTNLEAISTFGRSHNFDVRRLALNMDQVEEHNPPPNPAKETDSRFAEYERAHGDESWELDALDPAVLDGVVRDGITGILDQDRFDAALAHEAANETAIREVAQYLALRHSDAHPSGVWPATFLSETAEAAEEEDQGEED